MAQRVHGKHQLVSWRLVSWRLVRLRLVRLRLVKQRLVMVRQRLVRQRQLFPRLPQVSLRPRSKVPPGGACNPAVPAKA